MSAIGNDPATPPVEGAAAAEQTPVEPQAGPWASELAEYFADDTSRAAADRFMREKIQPSRTQFEMETAPARELWSDMTSDPTGTLASLAAELYGEEIGEKFLALFGDEGEPAAAAPAEVAPADGEIDLEKLPAPVRALVEKAQRDEAEREYNEALAGVRSVHNDLTDDDMDLIHPFVHAAGGDMEAAYQGYANFKQRFITANGVAPATAEEEVPEPPAVLGTQGATAAAPPTVKKYANIDEAMDDWFAEKRASAPTVVGQV